MRLWLALVRHLLLLSLRFSTGCRRLSSRLAPLAYTGLVFAAPSLNLAARQGQDHSTIVDGIGVVPASLPEAAIAEDGKLLLFRPALARGRRAAKQHLEFPACRTQVECKDRK